MSFARYKGNTVGKLIEGKVYPVRDAMGGSAAGSEMVVHTGGSSILVPKEEMVGRDWEVSEKVYAAVLRPLEDLKPGEVVVVEDWADDGKLEVEGVGFYNAEYLEMLDRTNVFPGVTVLDTHDDRWKRIVAVDEALWVRVNGEFKSPEEFVFPVSEDGELMTEPLVTCLTERDPHKPYSTWGGLTKGKKYYLLETSDNKHVVKNDDFRQIAYPKSMFRMG